MTDERFALLFKALDEMNAPVRTGEYTVKQVAEIMGVSTHCARRRLNYLEQSQQVTVRRAAKEVLYFPLGDPKDIFSHPSPKPDPGDLRYLEIKAMKGWPETRFSTTMSRLEKVGGIKIYKARGPNGVTTRYVKILDATKFDIG